MHGSRRVTRPSRDPARLRTVRRGTASHFGSALTGRFSPETSDIDFLLTFQPERESLFHDFFDLKFELERIVGRGVDLIMERSVKNPFFKAAAVGSAQHVYAA